MRQFWFNHFWRASQIINLILSKWNLTLSIYFLSQDSNDKRYDTRPCESCGLNFPCRTMKKIKEKDAKAYFLCEHCVKVRPFSFCNLYIFREFLFFEFLMVILLWKIEILFQLRKSKQYCGVCKQIWHHSDGGSWVRLSLLLLCISCLPTN